MLRDTEILEAPENTRKVVRKHQKTSENVRKQQKTSENIRNVNIREREKTTAENIKVFLLV